MNFSYFVPRAAHVPVHPDRLLRRVIFLILLTHGGSVAARDSGWAPTTENAAWRNECGACHSAFAPALLPSAAWADIMASLREHFGADASVDASTHQEIAAFLQRNGSDERYSADGTQAPRITRSERFVYKHRSAIRLWQKGQVKNLIDCSLCHRGADPPAPKP